MLKTSNRSETRVQVYRERLEMGLLPLANTDRTQAARRDVFPEL